MADIGAFEREVILDEELAVVAAVVGALMEPMNYIYEGEDEETALMAFSGAIPVPRVPISRIEGFVERIVPSLTAEEFQRHFRVFPPTFEFILGMIGDKLRRWTDGSEMIPVEKQLLLTLWRLATPDSYRSIHQRFGVGKATAIRAVWRVTEALVGLAPAFILWPSPNKIPEIVSGFSRGSGFPGTIGAIDGTHINIPAPKNNPESYINRKGHHSMHLQAVCDHRGVFTHCYVGNVGSVHDARVFRLSSVSGFLTDGVKFPNGTHLLGDSAYALHCSLMTPYVDNGRLSERNKNYNFCHSSTRMAIERAFGLLKGRWRSLLDKLALRTTGKIPRHIMACCVLHNICLLRGDVVFAVAIDQPTVEGGGDARLGDEDRAAAVAKRDAICANLQMRIV